MRMEVLQMIYREFLGHQVSLLGFGAMRLPALDPADPRGGIDKEAAIALIRQAYESGVNYFDTAYVYGGGESEKILGEALSIYPRDTYFVATKFPGLHPPAGGWTMEKVQETFEEQLQKLGMEYVDFYLLHGIMESDAHLYMDPEVPLADYFYGQKQAGRIKHFGFSSHAKVDLLEKVLQWKDYFEFCQIQLNYLDWKLQDAEKQYELLQKYNMPVIVMEPVRGGRLANLDEYCTALLKAARPEDSIASWALRFAGALPQVKVVLSGMSATDQLVDNLKTFEGGELLTEEEKTILLDQVVPSMVDMVPCTGCRYCTHECPQGLNIPALISLYNEMNFGAWSFYLGSLKEADMPSNCIGCGACMSVCPQGIDIPDVMQKLAKKIEEAKAARG